jgi:hypothetical protein
MFKSFRFDNEEDEPLPIPGENVPDSTFVEGREEIPTREVDQESPGPQEQGQGQAEENPRPAEDTPGNQAPSTENGTNGDPGLDGNQVPGRVEADGTGPVTKVKNPIGRPTKEQAAINKANRKLSEAANKLRKPPTRTSARQAEKAEKQSAVSRK